MNDCSCLVFVARADKRYSIEGEGQDARKHDHEYDMNMDTNMRMNTNMDMHVDMHTGMNMKGLGCRRGARLLGTAVLLNAYRPHHRVAAAEHLQGPLERRRGRHGVPQTVDIDSTGFVMLTTAENSDNTLQTAVG